ncbi:MAG: serine/threonine protein kinase, partial [Sandaracinaceae bacterium]
MDEPKRLLGPYELGGVLAEGGMGAVHRARHILTGDDRAVKVIHPTWASNPAFTARFIRELRLATRVRHPNLVEVYEPS